MNSPRKDLGKCITEVRVQIDNLIYQTDAHDKIKIFGIPDGQASHANDGPASHANDLLIVYGIKFQNLGEPKIAIFKWL